MDCHYYCFLFGCQFCVGKFFQITETVNGVNVRFNVLLPSRIPNFVSTWSRCNFAVQKFNFLFPCEFFSLSFKKMPVFVRQLSKNGKRIPNCHLWFNVLLLFESLCVSVCPCVRVVYFIFKQNYFRMHSVRLWLIQFETLLCGSLLCFFYLLLYSLIHIHASIHSTTTNDVEMCSTVVIHLPSFSFWP